MDPSCVREDHLAARILQDLLAYLADAAHSNPVRPTQATVYRQHSGSQKVVPARLKGGRGLDSPRRCSQAAE